MNILLYKQLRLKAVNNIEMEKITRRRHYFLCLTAGAFMLSTRIYHATVHKKC